MSQKYSDLNTSLPKNVVYPEDSYPLVMVFWIDAVTIGGEEWLDKSKAQSFSKSPLPIMVTVGFVLHEDEDHFAVTNTIGPDETAQVNKIPKRMIIEITDLKDGRTEEHKT